MDTFKYKGLEYPVVDAYETSGHETWQKGSAIKTGKTIVKTIFPIFPILKGKKFRWFKKCKVRYRLYFTRSKQFDDGWTYQEYWTDWKHSFGLEEIIT